jgi:cellulose synthase/poly-beta-1,6-N-acetylglucosamine synthase-like glycosyltransferase
MLIVLMRTPIYSIVIPAFQEEHYIGAALEALDAYLCANTLLDITEILVVAAGDDNTQTIANSYANRFSFFQLVVPRVSRGKGSDVRTGMLAARGKYVVFMDADMATPLHHLDIMFAHLKEGKGVVIGERRLEYGRPDIGLCISKIGHILAQLVVSPGFRDTQCGFKGFSQEAVRCIFPHLFTAGWVFDMEVLARAQQQRLLIVSMDIHDWHEPRPADQQLAGGQNALAVA